MLVTGCELFELLSKTSISERINSFISDRSNGQSLQEHFHTDSLQSSGGLPSGRSSVVSISGIGSTKEVKIENNGRSYLYIFKMKVEEPLDWYILRISKK